MGAIGDVMGYADEFTISRREWSRGDGAHESCLLRSNDKMKCCLGFYSLHVGISEQGILNVSSPGRLKVYGVPIPPSMTWLVDPPAENCLGNSKISQTLMDINDSVNMEDPEREERIAEIFAEQGIGVNFAD